MLSKEQKQKALKLAEMYVYDTQLTDLQRQFYKLIAWENKTPTELQKDFGKSSGVIRSHYARALSKVRSHQKFILAIINNL